MRVFVTGASGWIGSAVVPELLSRGHQVTGLARSEASADAMRAAGVEVRRGSLDDLDVVRREAAAADGVLHLAFKHDIAFSGDFPGAADADRRVVEIVGEALAGTGRPFVIASGLLGVAPGRVVTERDASEAPSGSPVELRQATARTTIALASHGVRSSVVRLPPTVHGRGDPAFMTMLIGIAREKRVSAYIGDGGNRWPAVHRLDAARLFRPALETAPAGSVLHANADEGVPMRTIAETIGRHLDIPVAALSREDAAGHFNFLADFLALDGPASSAITRELLAWEPTHPGLIEDLDEGHYF